MVHRSLLKITHITNKKLVLGVRRAPEHWTICIIKVIIMMIYETKKIWRRKAHQPFSSPGIWAIQNKYIEPYSNFTRCFSLQAVFLLFTRFMNGQKNFLFTSSTVAYVRWAKPYYVWHRTNHKQTIILTRNPWGSKRFLVFVSHDHPINIDRI